MSTSASSSESGSSSSGKANPLAGLAHFGSLRDPRHRWLPPLLLGSLCALLLAACGGMVLSGLVFGGAVEVVGPCLGQSFVLFASLLAFPFVYLYVWSSRKQYSLVRSHAFQHPLHSWTTIVARMDLLAWFAALITVCVDVSREKGPMAYLRADLFVCVLAFLANLATLCAVEVASDPFILPCITPLTTVLSRSNTLVADRLDDSVSRRGSAEKRRDIRPAVAPMGPRPLEKITQGSENGDAGREMVRRPDQSPRMPASWPASPLQQHAQPQQLQQLQQHQQYQAQHQQQRQQAQPQLQHQQHPQPQHQSPQLNPPHHRPQQHQQDQAHHQTPPYPHPLPPVHHRPTPSTPSTDWRHDWSALAGEAGVLGRANSLLSTTSSSLASGPSSSLAAAGMGSYRAAAPPPHPPPTTAQPSLPYPHHHHQHGGWAGGGGGYVQQHQQQHTQPLPPPPPPQIHPRGIVAHNGPPAPAYAYASSSPRRQQQRLPSMPEEVEEESGSGWRVSPGTGTGYRAALSSAAAYGGGSADDGGLRGGCGVGAAGAAVGEGEVGGRWSTAAGSEGWGDGGEG